MSVEPKKIAEKLREQAQLLRKQAQESQQAKLIKSAQVLTAAKGIVALKNLIQGGH